jgi:hypothetical protein
MAKLNILGALTTGLIEGGKAAQTYGAMKLKEEYMAEEKQAAAAAATSDKQKFLIEQVGKHRGKILDSLKSGNPLSGTISLDGGLRNILTKNLQLLGEAESVLVNLYMGGKGNSPEAQDAISTIMSVIDENNSLINEGGERSDVDLVGDTTFEGDEYKTPAGSIDVDQMQKDLVLAATRNAKKIGETDAAQWVMRVGGDFIEGIISQMRDEDKQIVKDWLDSKGFMPETSDPRTSGDLSEEQPNRAPLSTPMTPIDNSDQRGNMRGPTVIPSEDPQENAATADETSFGTMDNVNDLPATSATAVDPQASEQGLISAAETNTENFSEYRNKTRRESLLKLIANPKTSDKDRKEAEKILSEMGDAKEIANSQSSESLEEGDEQVITPEQDDIATTTNIPVESDEIEAKKKGLSADLIPFIKSKVSNDNGYSTVEGVSGGDSNLTSMTLEEIVKKYGNKAVGIGGFKPKEFIKTINKKYLGLSQEQLNNQVFSEEFQNRLIYLGLEEAGMTKFIKGEISLNEFQERTNRIFARIDERSSPKTGVISSDGSGLINKVLKEY